MSSLYELIMDFKEISDIDFEDDISKEQIEDIKEIIKTEIETKGTNIIALIKNIEGDITSIKSEIDRLTNLRRIKENKIKSIKNYTLECLKELDLKKVETTLGNISIRNNVPSVIVADPQLIHKKFKTETVIVDVDKKALKEAIKNGETVHGAYLQSSQSLMIK